MPAGITSVFGLDLSHDSLAVAESSGLAVFRFRQQAHVGWSRAWCSVSLVFRVQCSVDPDPGRVLVEFRKVGSVFGVFEFVVDVV